MGIAGSTARLLFKEHKYKPQPQAIHLLGRQTIHLGFDETSKLLNSEDIPQAFQKTCCRQYGQTPIPACASLRESVRRASA